MATVTTPIPPAVVQKAAARTVDAVKVYGKGQTEVRALDGRAPRCSPSCGGPWTRWARPSILTLGVAALFTGLFTNVASRVLVVGAGALLVFFGVSVLGRTVSLPLSRAVGAPLSRLRGVTGKLARLNAMRNPKRTAASASALMIGAEVQLVQAEAGLSEEGPASGDLGTYRQGWRLPNLDLRRDAHGY